MSPQGFDPDAWLKQQETKEKPPEAFDPDAWLKQQADAPQADAKGKAKDKPPAPPAPPSLDPNASVLSNYWRGAFPNDNPLSRIINMPQEGAHQVIEGAKRAWNASGADPWPERAAGAHEVVSGATHALAPLVIIPAVANPVGTAVALGTGAVAGWGAKTGLEAMGVRPEYAELGGDVGGIAGGAIGAKTLSGPIANKVPAALERSALKNYLRVLRTSPEDVPLAEDMAAKMAKEKIVARSRNSLQTRIAAEKAKLGPQAAAAYVGKPSVDPANIFEGIETLRRENATIQGPQGEVITNEPLHNAMTEMRDNLRAMQDEQGRIPAKALDDYRDQLFKGTVGATGKYRQMAPQSAKTMERGVAASIKGVLDSEFPDAAKINDAYHMRSKVFNFLEQARRQNVSAASKGQGSDILSKVVEAKMPGVVSIPLKLLNAAGTVPWNTVSGAIKQSLADALARGRWGEAGAILKPLQRPLPNSRGLPSPDIVTPPPETSGVRTYPGTYPESTRLRLPPPGRGPIVTPPPADPYMDPARNFARGVPGQYPRDLTRLTTGDIAPPHSLLDPHANPSFELTPGKFPEIDRGSFLEVYDPKQKKWVRMAKPGFSQGGQLRAPTRGEVLRSLRVGTQ